MGPPDLYFKDAIAARTNLTKRQEKYIRKLYNEWAREVRNEAKSVSGNLDYAEQKRLADMYYRLRNASVQLSGEINNSLTSSINDIGKVVVETNKRWLTSLGLSTDAVNYKMSVSKDIAIRSILTGNLYSSPQPLSARVWDLSNGNLKDIYSIISRGIAMNMSTNDIARQLEKYLNPSKTLGWTIQRYVDKNGVVHFSRVHNNVVDWRARRLARTTIQHAYQQTLVALTKDNPFVIGYIWHANGANACEICLDRDGQFYTADDMPLDHPNGQCDFEVAVDEQKIAEDLQGFYENPIYYPDIQRFVSG